MKKLLTAFFILFLAVSFNPGKTFSQDTNNVLIEYCTGTWCQWCPCGHTIIQGILQSYPNTVVLGYHGAGSDPWQSYSAGIRGLMGFSAYPTGVIGRRTGIISRSAWNNQVVIQTISLHPSVRIEVEKTYNSSTRQLDATANVIVLQTIPGNYYLNFVITESGMIYPQTGNSSCPGGSNYVHHHVVKGMLNGDQGQSLNTDSLVLGDTISKSLNYTIPGGFVAENCELITFVYLSGGSFSSSNYVQQAKQIPVEVPTGVGNNGATITDYTLSQNYPNPFNPTTNIHFSVPKNGNVSLKFYDVLGNEVATYYDGFLNAGTYNAEFDGSTLSSGVYFYKLTADDFTATKKMILTK
ncbi:Omp28-related outer membrane protein [Bacteroidota bacterium]